MIRSSAPDYSNYIGLPYRWTEGEGLNCWELVELIMVEVFQVKPPYVEFDGIKENVAPLFVNQLSHWKQIDKGEHKEGDLVLLKVIGYPAHCGIMINKRSMIHTLKNSGSVIEQIDSYKWRNRLIGFYRWLGSEV